MIKGSSKLVLRPKTTEEVSKILSFCNKNQLAVCPQGGNTSISGGSIAVHDEIILSLSRMNTIIDLDDDSGSARAIFQSIHVDSFYSRTNISRCSDMRSRLRPGKPREFPEGQEPYDAR